MSRTSIITRLVNLTTTSHPSPNFLHPSSSLRRLTRPLSTTPGKLTDSSGLGPKRFYDNVQVAPSPSGGHAVLLDGNPVLTARRTPLHTPSRPLALAVAAEWDAVTTRVRPSAMPLTALTGAALDVVPTFRDRTLSGLMRYVHTDSACLRADSPHELVDQQDLAYDPIVRFANEGAGVDVRIVRGGLDGHQPDAVSQWVTHVTSGLDCWSLAALESATATAKSVLVALALQGGAVDAPAAVAAARSEERWQSTVWGMVEGGHDLDEADALVRLTAAEVVFRVVNEERYAFKEASDKLLREAEAEIAKTERTGEKRGG